MRIFFDHNVPAPLRRELPHPVTTAKDLEWDRLSNGKLLRAVEEQGFAIFLTCDQGIYYQQNLSGRKIAIILLTRNSLRLMQCRLQGILTAIDAATPGSFQVVDCAP